MKIIVTKNDQKPNISYVSFDCPYGNGHGVWRDEKAEIRSTIHVEFDIDKLHIIGIRPTADRTYVLEAKNDITWLTGNIAEIQDGILCFRFAETIIQLYRGVETLEVGEWITVPVKAENLLIYPLNL